MEKAKKARIEQELRQIDLADKAGVSVQSISLFEQGGRTSNRVKRRIAYALGLNVSTADLNRAKWASELDPQTASVWAGVDRQAAISSAEKKNEIKEKFGKELAEIFEQIEKKADIHEKEIFFNIDYQIGFQEIFWLARKYQIKFPEGIL